jgi:hypothetical protein
MVETTEEETVLEEVMVFSEKTRYEQCLIALLFRLVLLDDNKFDEENYRVA